MEDNYVEDAGNQASDLDSPVVEGTKNRVDMNDDDIQNVKINLNRSVSCGSILQSNVMNEKRNLSRRVSFPSDDKLISGYNEPKNPWEHAQETTTEDLIQAYTEACQTWNVRPISKLLLQLQEIRDFTVRANSLTLKGEKLEMRVVETLESIFKRVQFITIDLEATNLDEDAGASLFDMIEYYESAVNVLVGFNKNLGNRGWQAAAHMMRKMSCLRLFDGHSVPLSIQASPFVGRALRLSNTLVTLHLENAMLSGRPVLLIVAALRMNTTLRELFLADNRLSPLDALQLANLLKFNRILQLLDLRNNPIQDMGLGHLCSGLMAAANSTGYNGTSGGLQTLVLWNNQISCEGMSNLARALRYTTSLATLNLGQNVLTDDGVFKLKDGLLQNHSLLRLGLVGTKLTDEGAVAIAEYLAESPRIIRLDLRNNDIKVAGLMALSLAFKINYSLLRLDIDKPNKKDALKELAAKQESLMTDIINYSTRNKQAALEKAQAAQQRLIEARQAQAKEDSELRYMDMTNSSTSTSSTTSPPPTSSSETSANNSNNQDHETKDVEDSPFSATSDNTKEPSKHVTSNTEDDDSPEDSPEFLPRSSISYHQVSPVMLSNSEIAKRAAQSKLSPVHEQHEKVFQNTGDDHLNSSDTKMGGTQDAMTGANQSVETNKTSIMAEGAKFSQPTKNCENFETNAAIDKVLSNGAKFSIPGDESAVYKKNADTGEGDQTGSEPEIRLTDDSAGAKIVEPGVRLPDALNKSVPEDVTFSKFKPNTAAGTAQKQAVSLTTKLSNEQRAVMATNPSDESASLDTTTENICLKNITVATTISMSTEEETFKSCTEQLEDGIDKVTLESTENSDSIGFATDDNSVISGEMSPCDICEKLVNGDLLSPDSGVGELEIVDESKIFESMQSITQKNYPYGAMKIETSNTIQNIVTMDPSPDMPLEANEHHTSEDRPQIDSKSEDFDAINEASQILSENTKNDDYSAGDVIPNSEIVKTTSLQDFNSAPCEIEVSHFDLNKFPSD